jgi:hypothetical protein
VQPSPFAGQQVSVDDLAEQGVTDVVAVLAGGRDQQLPGDCGPQRLDQGLVVEADDGGQQPVGRASAGHRHHRQHLPTMVGERLDPAPEQVAQGRRELARAGPHDRQ